MSISFNQSRDGIPLVRLENQTVTVDVAPAIGGRIVSLRDRRTGYEFLWRNPTLTLQALPPESPYDPNFYGGIDELLPSDLPETIDGIESPDHGELWTTPLTASAEGDTLVLSGPLPRWGLTYERRMRLNGDSSTLILNYRICNPTDTRRVFLWKLHAAMNIQPGDTIICPSSQAVVVDPDWSRFTDTRPFPWPTLNGIRVDTVPTAPGQADFFFLYDLKEGKMAWESHDRSRSFTYRFDNTVFRYAWYFATYGKLDGLVTGILEPCTCMPLSAPEAHRLGQCSELAPGQTLETQVEIEIQDRT
jgi:galactose mutarotase-like enzyme